MTDYPPELVERALAAWLREAQQEIEDWKRRENKEHELAAFYEQHAHEATKERDAALARERELVEALERINKLLPQVLRGDRDVVDIREIVDAALARAWDDIRGEPT